MLKKKTKEMFVNQKNVMIIFVINFNYVKLYYIKHCIINLEGNDVVLATPNVF